MWYLFRPENQVINVNNANDIWANKQAWIELGLFQPNCLEFGSDGLFDRNRELYVEDEFDSDGMLVYKPPPLHEVWLDEAGRRQGKEDLLRQRRRNEDLMRSQKRETC